MKKEEKKEEGKKFKISEIFTNKRYYAIANLVFYSCVLLVLIAMVRINPSVQSNNNVSTEVNIEGFESIMNKNFNFKYTVKLDSNEIVYEGKQRDDKISFTQNNNTEYFRQNNIFLKNIDGNYVLDVNPNIYFDFFDVELIKRVLTSAEKDEEEYFVSNKDFSLIVENKDVDDTLYGVYVQVVKQNNIITSLIFDMSEYDKNVQSIVLEYQNYGLIEDFEMK